MLIIILILLFLFIFLITLFLLNSGNPIPFLDKNGKLLPDSISEKIFMDINGVKQGMFIKSKNKNNPVLLFLHGGMPEYFLAQKYPTNLEDHFTVVWWEQRGSGISYNANASLKKITSEIMISDTIEVTNYLRHRFNKEKIYLMGHSGGSFIGILAAARSPELYHAYIGVSQMSYQLKSEVLAYEYMLSQFKKNGNIKMVRKLEAAPVTLTDGVPDSYLSLRDRAVHGLGIGTARNMKSIVTGIILPSLMSKEYTLVEKINTWRGKLHSGVSSLWNEMLATDLSKQLTKFKIPIYFFSGIFDYTCSYTEAKSYFNKLNAPIKGFYTFEQSAHIPIFEEPKKMQKILQEDVLNGLNNLADQK